MPIDYRLYIINKVNMMTSICLNELANYNNGELVYQWFDLADYNCADEYHEAVREWLTNCKHPTMGECEEWNIADVDGVPSEFYDDYTFYADDFYKYKAIRDEVGKEKLDAWLSIFHELPETASYLNDRFIGTTEWDNDEYRGFHIEIGIMLVEQNSLLENASEEIRRYFNYAQYGKDHYSQTMAMHSGFIFSTC